MPLYNLPGLVQSVEAVLTVDTGTNQTSFQDLLTITLTTQGTILIVMADASGKNTNNNVLSFIRITVDGNSYGGAQIISAGGIGSSASICRRISGLTPGSHTIKLQYRAAANTININPVTLPDQDGAHLVVIDSNV
jgi:hypothetical protein